MIFSEKHALFAAPEPPEIPPAQGTRSRVAFVCRTGEIARTTMRVHTLVTFQRRLGGGGQRRRVVEVAMKQASGEEQMIWIRRGGSSGEA